MTDETREPSRPVGGSEPGEPERSPAAPPVETRHGREGQAEDGHAGAGQAQAGLPGAEDERAEGESAAARDTAPAAAQEQRKRRLSGAGVVIGLLLALLGFTLVVQVKSNTTDDTFASAREGDLLQFMSDLDASEKRLEQDISALREAKRDLQSGVDRQAAAQAEAKRRADALGILAGTLPAEGPGVRMTISRGADREIKAADLLDVVQDLRAGQAEAIQLNGTGGSVRVVASTSFVDSGGGVSVDGVSLSGPYTLLAIGRPDALGGSLEFSGGAVKRIRVNGGNVIVNQEPKTVEITTTRAPRELEHARPVS
jgi:uncharacterized protein YlxW (UPF0749 family)